MNLDGGFAATGEILLVEDNPRDAELTRRSFERHNLGDRLMWARDGAEALDMVFGQPEDRRGRAVCVPKVVLLDLKLPKVDGHEVLRRIKGDERTRTIPVVVLTSSKEEADIERSYELGANSYVVKPVEFENFSEAMRQIGMYWLVFNESPPGLSRCREANL